MRLAPLSDSPTPRLSALQSTSPCPQTPYEHSVERWARLMSCAPAHPCAPMTACPRLPKSGTSDPGRRAPAPAPTSAPPRAPSSSAVICGSVAPSPETPPPGPPIGPPRSSAYPSSLRRFSSCLVPRSAWPALDAWMGQGSGSFSRKKKMSTVSRPNDRRPSPPSCPSVGHLRAPAPPHPPRPDPEGVPSACSAPRRARTRVPDPGVFPQSSVLEWAFQPTFSLAFSPFSRSIQPVQPAQRVSF